MTPSDEAEFERTFVAGRIGPDGTLEPDTIGHYLVLVEGAEPGRRVELGDAPISIGRTPGQALVIADTQLSRHHARLRLENDKATVEDLGLTNGTFVDGERLTAPRVLEDGNVLRVGAQRFRYERRSRREVERTEDLERDLQSAGHYVLSLLPPPVPSGAVRADWRFVPSAQLGGDAFGYFWLDPGTFVFYLFDVAGHGVGSAMHSATVMNVLRQRALPQVDFGDPASVLSSLNHRFQMDGHAGLFFTMRYGVYRPAGRTITCASAGHHPAYLVPADRTATRPLGPGGLLIGIAPDVAYKIERTTAPPASTLYVFSDGAFEIRTADHRRWTEREFLPLLLDPPLPGTAEPDRIYAAVRQQAGARPLDDDFTLMAIGFP